MPLSIANEKDQEIPEKPIFERRTFEVPSLYNPEQGNRVFYWFVFWKKPYQFSPDL
jgi:hypothetical protein